MTEKKKYTEDEIQAELEAARNNPELAVVEINSGIDASHVIVRCPVTRDMVTRDVLVAQYAARQKTPEMAYSQVLTQAALCSILIIRAPGYGDVIMDDVLAMSRLDVARIVQAFEKLEDQFEEAARGNSKSSHSAS